jgi:CHRD domain
MPRFGVVIAAVAITAAVPLTLPAQAPVYRARLSVVPIDIAMQATVTGSGTATATLKGTALTITGTFGGLKTPATAARMHRGPRTAMRGPAIGDLAATAATSGTLSGTIELTKQQIDDLAAGRLYLQLHSEKAPEGNLWGWLLPETKK